MRMFGVLSVERNDGPGVAIRNCATGWGDVKTRSEMFDNLVEALPGGWREQDFIITFFYAEPDEPVSSSSKGER